MSLFPKKKKTGVDGASHEETVPLFPKETGIQVADRPTHTANGSRSVHHELFSKHTTYKSLTTNERELLYGQPNVVVKYADQQVSELIYQLFVCKHHRTHQHPRTNPEYPPEKRYARHRNYFVFLLNEFRHWWKTARLLVRLAGGTVYCQDALNWSTMALWLVAKPKQANHALKQMKRVGQGGSARLFLQEVHPFNRTLRIIVAICRAWEARVDNRFYEVGLAEGFAFMGNRCARYWSRQFVDWATLAVMFPLSANYLEPYLGQHSRPIIMLMGKLRALLPFAMSFQGSRFGRQVTFNTYKYAAYRWRSVQSIMKFHEDTGTYADTKPDPQLLALARQVAESIGHGVDPANTRLELTAIGFKNFGSGSGGYSVYQMDLDNCIILLHVTPYGPSIFNEMPRYVLLERRKHYYVNRLVSKPDGVILDAATPRQAKIRGFTYSGAFFKIQEWAALKTRYDEELLDYSNACHTMNTHTLPKGHRYPMETKMPAPPTDLVSLKAFIRRGRQHFQQRRDNARWKETQAEVKKMAKLVAKYQKKEEAPKQVILYLEGLDCAGKSSTGMLICQALEECGYSVTLAQHNTPPTPEQRAKPWMDRIRFEYPDDMYPDESQVPEYASVVWDRGPAGDFVYGALDHLPPDKKLEKYNEFRKYDFKCRQEGVLFFKCMFVASRDSIASTLGKRLAHKKIAQDLRTWLDANSVAQTREGLEEIELHLDPTDFVAFNNYEENLHKFSEFARNTDTIGRLVTAGGDEGDAIVSRDAPEGMPKGSYDNPWLVINTTKRHAARMNIIKVFQVQLDRYAKSEEEIVRPSFWSKCKAMCTRRGQAETRTTTTYKHIVPSDIVDQVEYGLSIRAVLQSLVLFVLLYLYAYQTWNFDIEYLT